MESKTIFDLPTSVAELSEVNQSMSRMQYDQVAPTRTVVGTAFPNGQIHTRFEISGTKRWIPSKSYIRLRCSLTSDIDSDVALTSAADVAPNMGLCANLFQSGEFRIADKTVSRCSDYMAQIDALSTRLDKSKAWMDSIGEATNMWESDVKLRREKVSSDGKILKNDVAVPDISTGRDVLGFGPAGGADATANTSVKYDAGAATLTFLAGLTNTTTIDARTAFPIGSYFQFLTLNAPVDAVSNVLMEIIAHTSATVINVRPVVGEDITPAADGRDDFGRVVKSSGGVPSRRVKTFELTWQPPMSIFKVQHALPAGKFELVLNPQTSSSFELRAIESLLGAKTAPANFTFHVEDMYLMVATVESSLVEDLTYYIDLDEVRCQVDTLAGTNLQQKNFDVSPSSYALTAAFQDEAAGSNSLYSASKFKTRTNNELSLTRLFLTYAGQSKPSPDADPSFIAGSNDDRTTQRYSDSLLQAGHYWREGGAETIEEFHERGSYYHFAWPRSGRDRSTRCQVNFQMTTPANSRVLLFDHYKSLAHISVKDGRVVDVNLIEA